MTAVGVVLMAVGWLMVWIGAVTSASCDPFYRPMWASIFIFVMSFFGLLTCGTGLVLAAFGVAKWLWVVIP